MEFVIPKHAEAVVDMLWQNGYEAYIVGGCVRDVLLFREPNDWDVTTSARPEATMKIFSAREGFHAIPTGIAHGTVTVIYGGVPVEVTTYRIDGEYSDSRHPDRVEFTSDLFADLARRDFTVNAMAYSHTRGIVDPYGGVRDLEARTVRAVGDAHERFAEDALRIMRALRFAAELGFAVHSDTANAALELASTLGNISKERITSELSRLLLGRDAARVMREHARVLVSAAPALDEKAITKASERISQLPGATLPLALAALLADSTDDGITEFFGQLRFDNRTVYAAKSILGVLSRRLQNKPSVKRLCRDIGMHNAREAVRLLGAMGAGTDSVAAYLDEIERGGECCTRSQLKIGGRELLLLGYEPKSVGGALDALLEAVICESIDNESDALTAAARRLLKEKDI